LSRFIPYYTPSSGFYAKICASDDENVIRNGNKADVWLSFGEVD
jgi:hypothetical protein